MKLRRILLSAAVTALTCLAAEVPEASISNGLISAKLYLPDAQHGYYQGTRFDWSGVIASLTYDGHSYFGKWFDKYDPKIHDAISGPVEAFHTDGAALGYKEAKPGETFVRIGVGSLRKPEEQSFQDFKTYEIVDPGKWTVNKGADWIEFVQDLEDPAGYGYRYSKTIRLTPNKPEMTIAHTFRNTGKRAIESDVFNHNFFVIDGHPTGPEFVVKFPFELHSTRDLQGLAEVDGKELHYLKELQKGQSTYTELKGFGDSKSDYDITVENAKAGAGVHITGDRPLSKLVFWSIRTTLSPEAYVQFKVEPGQEFSWRMAYDFYSMKPAQVGPAAE